MVMGAEICLCPKVGTVLIFMPEKKVFSCALFTTTTIGYIFVVSLEYSSRLRSSRPKVSESLELPVYTRGLETNWERM